MLGKRAVRHLQSAVNIEDLRKMAARRLPAVVFDYLDGGCGDELGIAHNRATFTRYRLTPHYGVDVSRRDTSTTVFGRTYRSPIGIAPTGLTGLFRRGGELMLAAAAAAADVPYVMSCVATTTIEAAVAVAGTNLWFQIYGNNTRTLSRDMLIRARNAGVSTLVCTVDAPLNTNRERNQRNGFGAKTPLGVRLEALTHPAWILEYLRNGGFPLVENFVPQAPGLSRDEITALVLREVPSADQTWADVKAFRDQWPGKFVVKGVLHPADAVRAIDIGADAVWISNHGGRQLDFAPSPIDVLPLIRDAVDGRALLFADSGFRRGGDVIIARCLGADLAFLGRPMLYGLAAGGLPGAKRALDLITNELDLLLGQLGCVSLADLGPQMLFDGAKNPMPAN